MKKAFIKNTKKAIISFDNNELEVKIESNKTNSTGIICNYSLQSIKSYVIQFPNRRFAVIKLNFKDKNSVEYSFWRVKQAEDQVDTDTLIESVHSYLTAYNKGEIELKPSFMGSLGGLLVIICLCIGILSVIILFALHGADTKKLPAASIVAIGIIIQLIAQRVGDISFYKKMKGKV